MGWSAFLHSIQLNKNLAPTVDFAGAVKMATLKLHLSPGRSPNGQQFVLRKAEKIIQMVQCIVHADGGTGVFSDRHVAGSPPLQGPGSGLPAVPTPQRPCVSGAGGPELILAWQLILFPGVWLEMQELGAPWTRTRDREWVRGDVRGAAARLQGAEPQLDSASICCRHVQALCLSAGKFLGGSNPNPVRHVDTSPELQVASLCLTAS